jgi:beta-lactamase regulating signal transducer with metallopeptidase domain
MNQLLHSLATEEWAYLVKALLHTLWVGGLVSGGLCLVLRRKTDPVTRYRCCVSALLAVVLSGIVAWAVLECRPVADHPPEVMTATAIAQGSGGLAASSSGGGAVVSPRLISAAQPGQWTPWLALLWLGGVVAMLARAGSFVAEAENLRRGSRPLENQAVLQLVEEARRKLGLMRRVQVMVTEQITSPAVMGLVTPVLLLPLSVVTTMPMGQIHLILLHELAHIRRGDYLVNLCQLLTESLLFFNPAVWWISRQIRQEREACCDAMAIALVGEPLEYARTLAEAAGAALAAAPAFGDRRNPSGLKDRIQRLLVPGYRPTLRLTWSALLTALFVGGGLLFLSALGTRITVAAILSPQERIDRIAKKMTEMGENPDVVDDNGDMGELPKVSVSGRVRMADGSPAPEWIAMDIVSVAGRSSTGMGGSAQSGFFSNSVPAGTVYIGAEVTNFAPVCIGPLDGMTTNRLENLELVIEPGFDAMIQLVDADSGKPVAGGKLSAQFWLRGVSQSCFYGRALTADENGSAVLTHAADLPLTVSVNVPGYEILDQRFESVQPGKSLRIALHAGAKVSGQVRDKNTGQPIAGATVRVRYEKGPTQQGYGWDDTRRILATTDQQGRFVADQLRKDTVYWLGVSAAGHESVVLNNVRAGSALEARLGPELIVKGRIIGDLDQLQKAWHRQGRNEIDYSLLDDTAENHGSVGYRAGVRIVDGVGYFQITNQAAGGVQIHVAGQTFERTVDAPMDDWVIHLNQGQKVPAINAPKREVIFRFKHPPGAPPRGTVSVSIQDIQELSRNTAHNVEIEVSNGEVHVEVDIGGKAAIQAKHMVGYWFNHWSIGDNGGIYTTVTNGAGPMVIEIPLVPAGAIFAKARNADGSLAGGEMFGVSELKRAPELDKSLLMEADTDSFSGNAPRRWVSGALPLGGIYQIHAWRGNSFCVSKPIQLTEANPEVETELQFPPGKTFDGVVLDPDGKPLGAAKMTLEFDLPDGHSFGLPSVFTDERGRFHVENMTPDLGSYSVVASAPGARTEDVKLDFGSQPQTIRLQRGRTLAGRLVQAGTGYVIPNAEVRAVNFSDNPMPTVTAMTTADGRFAFDNLGDAEYAFFVAGGQLRPDKKYRADGSTNVLLSAQLYKWSKAQPKVPQ